MSFGGTPLSTRVQNGRNICEVRGGSLAANAGVFAAGAVDSARLQTLNPAAGGNFQIPIDFGPGSGLWQQSDVDSIHVEIVDDSGAVAASNVKRVACGLSAGNLQVDVQNKSATATVALKVRITYDVPGVC